MIGSGTKLMAFLGLMTVCLIQHTDAVKLKCTMMRINEKTGSRKPREVTFDSDRLTLSWIKNYYSYGRKKRKTITAQDFKVDSITSPLGLATHTVTYGDNEVRSFECLSPTKEGRNKFDTFWTEAKIQHTDASRFTTCRMFQGQDL